MSDRDALPETAASNGDSLQIGFVVPCIGEDFEAGVS